MHVDRSFPVRSSGNLLLRSLTLADHKLIADHVEELSAPGDTIVMRAGEPFDAVFFPSAGLVSLEARVDAARSVEVAVVGREGMLGCLALLGGASSPHTAVVRIGGGTLLRMGVAPLRAACDRSPSLRAALLAFVHVLAVQATATMASHLGRSLGERVARWLLMRHDRVGGDILLVHHDEIAASLAVRRASITDQLHLLEGLLLIRSTRGRITVRDRMKLEAFAGEAYGQPEAQYRALIGPFGKSTERAGAPPTPPARAPIDAMPPAPTPTLELEL